MSLGLYCMIGKLSSLMVHHLSRRLKMNSSSLIVRFVANKGRKVMKWVPKKVLEVAVVPTPHIAITSDLVSIELMLGNVDSKTNVGWQAATKVARRSTTRRLDLILNIKGFSLLIKDGSNEDKG